MNGFVTLGKAELMLTFFTVAVLMVILGVAVGQIWLMARRPAVVKPQPCPMLHCDDETQLNSWLRLRDYSLITNELLTTLDFSTPRGRHAAQDETKAAWPSSVSGPISPEDAKRMTEVFTRHMEAPSPLEHWFDGAPDAFEPRTLKDGLREPNPLWWTRNADGKLEPGPRWPTGETE